MTIFVLYLISNNHYKNPISEIAALLFFLFSLISQFLYYVVQITISNHSSYYENVPVNVTIFNVTGGLCSFVGLILRATKFPEKCINSNKNQDGTIDSNDDRKRESVMNLIANNFKTDKWIYASNYIITSHVLWHIFMNLCTIFLFSGTCEYLKYRYSGDTCS